MKMTLWFILRNAVGKSLSRKRDIKLRKHMTGRQNHQFQILRIPRRKNHPTIIRIRAQLVYNIGNLINALSRIIGLRILIFRAEMAPLETVDGTQVANFTVSQTQIVEEFAGTIAIPDLYADFVQRDG
jgi:hypothetical protein